MKITLEIPKEFEGDYNDNQFEDFFQRALSDMSDGVMCGLYERETAQMFIKAFKVSKKSDKAGVIIEKRYEPYTERFSGGYCFCKKCNPTGKDSTGVILVTDFYSELETKNINHLKDKYRYCSICASELDWDDITELKSYSGNY